MSRTLTMSGSEDPGSGVLLSLFAFRQGSVKLRAKGTKEVTDEVTDEVTVNIL